MIHSVKLAKQVTYPLKVIWSREEDTRYSGLRPYHYNHLSAGLDAQNRLVAWTHKVTGASILARWAPPLSSTVSTAMRSEMPAAPMPFPTSM